MLIRRLAVIGVGLIGGSLARALRHAGQVDEIVGCGRSRENLDKALNFGVIDRFTHEIGEAVSGADMIFTTYMFAPGALGYADGNGSKVTKVATAQDDA